MAKPFSIARVTVEEMYRVDRSAVERQLGHPIRELSAWGDGDMAGRPKGELPAKAKRTGMRRLVVDLGDVQAEQLEELRVKHGDRSWAQTIRNMIAYEANRQVTK